MRITLLLPALIAVAAVAGCGSTSSSATDPVAVPAYSSPSPVGSASTASAAKGPKLTVVASDYGRILSNGRGRALYLFTADDGKGSNCSGDCATAWPPYIVKSKPIVGPGAKRGLIGTTRRNDGTLQATYAGHPVYYYIRDNQPGEVLCQAVSEFGGYWYVLRANGKAIH
jgi:predicted lipoprotein with Yx(FWY)xxD motif